MTVDKQNYDQQYAISQMSLWAAILAGHSPLYWYKLRLYFWQKPRLFEFYKSWGFSLRFYRSGYNDWNYPHIHIQLIYGSFFITIPFWPAKRDYFDAPTYGCYYFENAFVICLGKKSEFIYMPWDKVWVRTSALCANGWWEHDKLGRDKNTHARASKDFWDTDKWKGILFSETHPFTYTLKSGKVQERTATIRVEEREWRPRWFKWTSIFSKIRKTIEIEFSDEVGERSGSWKGGTIGCGYEMLPNETPAECLRRMERDRKF